MGSTRFEIEKFNGKGDFGMWRKKMRDILVQQKCAKAFGGETDLPNLLSAEEKQDLIKTSYITIVLNLADIVLRQVNDEDIAAKIWIKLESLYMTKSLSGKIYLKEQLFGFKMDQSKSLEDNLDLKAAIKYGRDLLTLEDVVGALRSREMEMRSKKRASNGKGLNVRGRHEKRIKLRTDNGIEYLNDEFAEFCKQQGI
ncbi:hypothetical protein UlMin_038788 [Ulmus minor]